MIGYGKKVVRVDIELEHFLKVIKPLLPVELYDDVHAERWSQETFRTWTKTGRKMLEDGDITALEFDLIRKNQAYEDGPKTV